MESDFAAVRSDLGLVDDSHFSGTNIREREPPTTGGVSGATHVASGLPLSVTSDKINGSNLQWTIKRGMDIVLATAALFTLFPLLIIVALAIKITSPGPVLFVQFRDGIRGTTFPMFKFRTMYAHLGDASGVKQTKRNDPRITRIGAFLRRTSIDELPQLFNILRGDMSVIGPRPHPIEMLAAGKAYRALVPYYDMRHAVRPGLSGWAQANGYRGLTGDSKDAIDRINHDIAYIQNFSLLLDLRIIMHTISREFLSGSGF